MDSPQPMDSSHKGPVTQKPFPFDDVIMIWSPCYYNDLAINIYHRQSLWVSHSTAQRTSNHSPYWKKYFDNSGFDTDFRW